MRGTTDEVIEAIHGDKEIPEAAVLAWMTTPDLRTKGAVYHLTDRCWSRISPELSASVQCPFMAAYLLECIERNPLGAEYLHSGFEAAWEFAAWLKHLHSRGAEEFIWLAVSELECLFRRADESTRSRIETGALEHMLEESALRRYVSTWANDPALAPAWQRALEWGEAHERDGA